jgi:hypothetical protein
MRWLECRVWMMLLFKSIFNRLLKHFFYLNLASINQRQGIVCNRVTPCNYANVKLPSLNMNRVAPSEISHFVNKCPLSLALFQTSPLLSSPLLASETERRARRSSGSARCLSSLCPPDHAGPPPRLPLPVVPRWSAPLHRRPAAPPSHLPMLIDTSPQRSSASPNAASTPCARRLLPLALPAMT